jgi:superfamily II DNA or RNA helicase
MEQYDQDSFVNNPISSEFFASFRKSSLRRVSADSGKEFKFKIYKSGNSGVRVEICDTDNKPILVDKCLATNKFQQRALSILRQAAGDVDGSDWLGNLFNVVCELAKAPTLLPALLQCDNVVNADMKPVKVVADIADLYLDVVRGEKDFTAKILAEVDGKSVEPILLADGYVLLDDTIYQTQFVGENYSQLPMFASNFPANYLDCFLSIFYSYIENVKVRYNDYEEVFHKSELSATPVIYFEKVDGDNSLYLQLMSTVANLPANFADDFNLTYAANVDDEEHKIHVRPLATNDFAGLKKELTASIQSAAPSAAMRKQIYVEDNFYIIPQDVAGNFLLSRLMPLLSKFKLAGLTNIKQYKIYPVKPKLSVNLNSGIDFLEGDVQLSFGEETFTLRQVLDQYRKNHFIKLKDGSRGVVDDKFIQRLSSVFQQKKNSDKVKVSFFDLGEVESLLEQRVNDETFNHRREVYEGFNNLKKVEIKLPKVKAKLRDYQVEGVKWMDYLHTNKLGGCLADDMGLGKTLQTITMLSMIYPKAKKPSLIVMPKSLIFNWQSEIEKFAPKLKYHVYYESGRNIDEAMKSQVILTTYAMVRNDIKDFLDKKFEYVILDESQSIKNVGAQVSQAVKLLKANYRLALSGTPIENNLTELYSLFSFLNPSMFGTLDDFNARYTVPIVKDGNEEVQKALRNKIFPFLLRRLKKDVLTQLPERVEQKYFVEMSPAQAKYYEERRLYYKELISKQVAIEGVGKSQLEIFKALNELRRIASIPESMTDGAIESPKIEPIIDNIAQAVSNGHKIVIFFNYIAGVEALGEKLSELGIGYATMTGATQNRGDVVRQFQTGADCKVLLMTLKTGGVGLNLTAADIVYIFEPWWNRAAEEQAISRLHRIGQHNTVFSYSMITRGTIEEKICQLQEQKQQLFDSLIGNDAAITKQLSAEEIDYILS